MSALLPTVTRETAISAVCDLLREEITNTDGDGLLIEWVRQAQAENPEVTKSLGWLLDGQSEESKSIGIAAMAITYRVLSAQAEISALNAMAFQSDPIAAVLAEFEQQSVSNYRAVNGIVLGICPDCKRTEGPDGSCGCCGDCGMPVCVCVSEVGIEDRYDHEVAMEAAGGPYVEGDLL